MTELQLKYFNALREHHLTLAASLNDPSIKGVREVISNLYRDDAHFIYELLQNADDQGATSARFILSDTDLIFIHNAPRHFTITDHTNHEKDKEAGTLGDVNSILSIASSSKNNRQDEVPIGKFGLGFKSVFLFTDEPEIYDDNFRFYISDYIVPNLIPNDHPLRKNNETLFRFRFKTGEEREAYGKISDKLQSLVNPILFLNSLLTIEWNTVEDKGSYKLEETGRVASGKKLRYEVISDNSEKTLELWKFDSPIDESKKLFVSVVYAFQDGVMLNAVHPLYCYLPTANTTDLPVILHAPFKLTGNRESIMANDSHNRYMISRLSELLVKSLKEICILGEQNQTPWINDNILNFLPKQESSKEVFVAAKLDIEPLTKAVQKALETIPMLWCDHLGKYLLPQESFVADNGYLADIYESDLLKELYGVTKGWVLSSLISEWRKSAEMTRLFGVERLTPEKILRRITPAFLERRSLEWLKEWYRSLLKVPNVWKKVGKGGDPFLRYQPIIKTHKGIFVAPYSKGKETPNVCLPSPGAEDIVSENIYIIPEVLTEDEEVKSFFRDLGITGIDSFTMAEKVYLPKVNSENLDFSERLQNLIWLIGTYDYSLTSSQQQIIKKDCKLPGHNAMGWDFYDSEDVKIHNADNDFYFKGLDTVPFFEKDKLPLSDSEEIRQIDNFIRKYESVHCPTVRVVKKCITNDSKMRIPSYAQKPGYLNRWKIDFEWIEEPEILEYEHFLSHSAATDPKKASELIERLWMKNYGAKYCSIYYNSEKAYEIEAGYKTRLRQAKWIDLATPTLRKWLDLPVKELQDKELETIRTALSNSGIVSQDDVESLLEFMDQRGVLKDFQMKQSIEEQKTVVAASNQCSLRWFKELLNLRLKYVQAGENDDIQFLITRLQEALSTLDMDDDTDLREALPDGINIIFGPPGTGKTTEIVRIISSILEEDSLKRILVLTPTNAAAKVVASRLNSKGIEASRGIKPHNKELADELLEYDIPVYDADEDSLPSVLAATVHYFAQTYSVKEGNYLHDVPWDAIFIDETSMVTLDYVMFALLKGKQINPECRFYLVGDPLQLPPITNLDPLILEEAQLDEFNFYSFIGLNEFSDKPTDILKRFGNKVSIRLLTTQYRSEEPLCEIMSNFAYKGKVKSDFKGEPLYLPEKVPSVFKHHLSIIRFPVSKPGNTPDSVSITELDKLKGSNYNIYSALLVKEMLQKLFYELRAENYERYLSIGIITPYTAQKKLIEKLLNTNPISRSVNIDVFVNTVHQFQGDEFDIVILVLNPPNMEMHPKAKILINKRYLINVATSRAKNSLIILYPDSSCKEKNFMHVNRDGEPNNIERVAEKVLGRKFERIRLLSKVIEEELFGCSDYLSKICEVTYHEDVNLHESENDTLYKFVKGGDTIDIIYSSPKYGNH